MPQTLRRSLAPVLVAVLGTVSMVMGSSGRGHLDNPMLPEGCGSCHVGHGMSDQPLLLRGEEDFCYQCHGSTDEANLMRSVGKLSPAADPVQIEREFDKPYRHPVDRTGDHRPTEQLPALAGEGGARHAECIDCHSPHSRQTIGGRFNVSGFTVSGARVSEAAAEHEICLKCHSEENVTVGRQSNLRLTMGPTARSSHPVAVSPTGPVAASMKSGMPANRMMRCTDCHGNDNPDGPRGPHGSAYPGLLVDQYDRAPQSDESAFAYALCYRCHSRESITANESFPLHKEHIEGDLTRSIPGTSCATCHNAHGSLEYTHLISFNPEVVAPDASGRLTFIDLGDGRGECYLMCHSKNHGPARY